jgi:DNA-directed RNA polymerase specialized sigma24 family protein
MSSSPKSPLKHRGDLSVGAQGAAQQVDSLLLRFAQGTDESESQWLAAQLISEHAEPIIQDILRYKLRVSFNHVAGTERYRDGEDVYGEVILSLLTRLQEFKTNPTAAAIYDFRGLVAAITYRACSNYLRKKNPQRASLKNKLRYILTRRGGFALWKTEENEWLCGFTAWRHRKISGRTARLQQLRDNPGEFEQAALPREDVRGTQPADLLAAIFNWLDSPINFDDLVNIVADLLGIKDQTAEPDSFSENRSNTSERLPDPRVTIATEVEQRIYLQRIWAEIGKLPPRQRSALLLNLTDPLGHGVIALLPVIGIASFREIAEVLCMSAEQLADLWNDLPLDDAAIAVRLGVTRQQVINLRKSARERLARRMKALGEKA